MERGQDVAENLDPFARAARERLRKQREKNASQDPAKKFDQEARRLGEMIRRFRVDSQRFLNGDLLLPPEEQREKIQSEIRRLRSKNMKGAAANFRLNSLEAQFNSHNDLLGRRIRAREKGELRRHQEAKANAALDPTRGVVIGKQLEPTAVKALFGGLQSTSMDFDRFRSYLDKQAQLIRSKTGCEEIQFRVAVENGKMRLKAKPIRD